MADYDIVKQEPETIIRASHDVCSIPQHISSNDKECYSNDPQSVYLSSIQDYSLAEDKETVEKCEVKKEDLRCFTNNKRDNSDNFSEFAVSKSDHACPVIEQSESPTEEDSCTQIATSNYQIIDNMGPVIEKSKSPTNENSCKQNATSNFQMTDNAIPMIEKSESPIEEYSCTQNATSNYQMTDNAIPMIEKSKSPIEEYSCTQNATSNYQITDDVGPMIEKSKSPTKENSCKQNSTSNYQMTDNAIPMIEKSKSTTKDSSTQNTTNNAQMTDNVSHIIEKSKSPIEEYSCTQNGTNNIHISAGHLQRVKGSESQRANKHPVLMNALLKKPNGQLEPIKVPASQVISEEKFKAITRNHRASGLRNEKQSIDNQDTDQEQESGEEDMFNQLSSDESDASSDNDTDSASEAEKERKKIYDFTCDTCNKKFSLHYRLLKHIKTHLYHRKMYKCRFCPMELTLKSGLERHERIHTNEKPFKCDECNKYFRTKDFLENHKFKDHGHDLPYLCDYCGMAFKKKTWYKNHISIHTGEKKYECNKCSKRFRRATDLRKHTRTNHQVLLCDVCSEMCSSKRELQRHKMTHVKRAFPCDQCEASFSQNSNLTKHKLIHLGLKPYVCDVCETAYAHRSNLNKHMKQAHILKSAVSLENSMDFDTKS